MDGIILINKPSGYTSHDIVNIMRRELHTKKVGHCGTLDTDATGLLVICVNKATKVLQFLSSDNKEYIATLSLGKFTDTYDASGKVLEEKTFVGVEEDNIIFVLKSFLGKQKQLPPIYSAIKVKGKKLYEYARNNEEVDIEYRDIDIKDIELLNINNNEITFRVSCSKGTYIRSLCVDIAKKLGYPGHMSKLIRTKSGAFNLNESFTLEDIANNDFKVISMNDVLVDFTSLVVEDENIVYHGKMIKSDINEQVAIYNKQGILLAIYAPNGEGYLKSVRGLW